MSSSAHRLIEHAAKSGRIKLTDVEQRIFSLLLAVVGSHAFDVRGVRECASKAKPLHTCSTTPTASVLVTQVKRFELKDTLRVAGGWVRDKLLGRTSLDIDITTDSLSGTALAQHIESLLIEKVLQSQRVLVGCPESLSHVVGGRGGLNFCCFCWRAFCSVS